MYPRFWISSCLKIALKLSSRKGAFHLVLAGHTYNKLGFKRFGAETNPGCTSCPTLGLSYTFLQSRLRLALFSYQAVVELYMGKGWSCCHVPIQLRKSKHSSTVCGLTGFTSLTTFISRWLDKHLVRIPELQCVEFLPLNA